MTIQTVVAEFVAFHGRRPKDSEVGDWLFQVGNREVTYHGTFEGAEIGAGCDAIEDEVQFIRLLP